MENKKTKPLIDLEKTIAKRYDYIMFEDGDLINMSVEHPEGFYDFPNAIYIGTPLVGLETVIEIEEEHIIQLQKEIANTKLKLHKEIHGNEPDKDKYIDIFKKHICDYEKTIEQTKRSLKKLIRKRGEK